MFKAWNVFDNGLNQDTSGHHFWETKSLAAELARRGSIVRIFSCKETRPAAEHFPGAVLTPAFSLYLYTGVSNDRAWGTLENFVVHNRTFHNDLAGLDPSQFDDGLVLLPTATERHLLGLFRWLEAFPGRSAPMVAACLRAPRDWSESDPSARLYKTLWAGCPPTVRKKIAFFARTEQNAAMFAKHTGMPARLFPFVLPEDHAAHGPTAGGTPRQAMVVSYLGGTKRTKGSALIADAVKQCTGNGVEFFIQVQRNVDLRFDTSVLTALSGLQHVRLHEGMLDREAFYRAIADSVVLLPYQPDAYRWNDSGIYHEALSFGAPVLVTAGTWMAEDVTAAGNGLVIADFSAGAIVDCINRAQRELPALKAAAAKAQQKFRQTNGAARCIEAITSASKAPAIVEEHGTDMA